eukprot:Em0006g1557a
MTSHVHVTDQATQSVAADDIPSGHKPRHTRGGSVKRRSTDDLEQREERKKMSFDSFFNFCSYVLAYEQQLASVNVHHPPQTQLNGHVDPNLKSLSHSSTSSLNSAPPTSSLNSAPPTSSLNAAPPTSSLNAAPPTSSLNSAGESSYSTSPNSAHSSGDDSGDDYISGSPPSEAESKLEYTSDDESWNIVTCFCRRPFAGRPMIECSKCQTWIHLYCAKIRKDQVPEVYTCPKCRTSSTSKKDRPHKSL